MTSALVQKKFLIMAGGTGGHVFPALAVAELLREKGADIHWLGAKDGMESRIAEKHQIPFSGIRIAGLRGKGLKTILMAPFKLLLAIGQALSVMSKQRPDCVVGFGGFASGPGGLAAWMRRIPLVIHEQNSIAGMTNRLLHPLAKRVLTAFPGAFRGKSGELIGNPLRKSFLAVRPLETHVNRHARLLILGGSLGAASLNSVVPEALSQVSKNHQPEIIHQSGKNKLEACRAAYEKYEVTAQIRPFIEDMRAAYDWADLVICRAGAMTIAELAVTGTPAILVPYPHAVDDHQTQNARYLSDQGAAILIPEKELSVRCMRVTLEETLSDQNKMHDMSENARALALPRATESLVEVCEELMNV